MDQRARRRCQLPQRLGGAVVCVVALACVTSCGTTDKSEIGQTRQSNDCGKLLQIVSDANVVLEEYRTGGADEVLAAQAQAFREAALQRMDEVGCFVDHGPISVDESPETTPDGVKQPIEALKVLPAESGAAKSNPGPLIIGLINGLRANIDQGTEAVGSYIAAHNYPGFYSNAAECQRAEADSPFVKAQVFDDEVQPDEGWVLDTTPWAGQEIGGTVYRVRLYYTYQSSPGVTIQWSSDLHFTVTTEGTFFFLSCEGTIDVH